VDAVRRALSELQTLETEIPNGIKDRIPKIARLLQDVEEHLENEDASAGLLDNYAKKIVFSPADSVSKMRSFDDSFNSGGGGQGLRDRELMEGDISDLPVLDGTPSGKNVLKVYMNNQLELQASEWEKYEEAFNSLDEELQAVTHERDTLREELARLSGLGLSEDLLIDFENNKIKLSDLESEYDKLSEVCLPSPSLISFPSPSLPRLESGRKEFSVISL
jgi:hypothetical protein